MNKLFFCPREACVWKLVDGEEIFVGWIDEISDEEFATIETKASTDIRDAETAA